MKLKRLLVVRRTVLAARMLPAVFPHKSLAYASRTWGREPINMTAELCFCGLSRNDDPFAARICCKEIVDTVDDNLIRTMTTSFWSWR
jgi:hypothetical protein